MARSEVLENKDASFCHLFPSFAISSHLLPPLPIFCHLCPNRRLPIPLASPRSKCWRAMQGYTPPTSMEGRLKTYENSSSSNSQKPISWFRVLFASVSCSIRMATWNQCNMCEFPCTHPRTSCCFPCTFLSVLLQRRSLLTFGAKKLQLTFL